MSGSPPGTPVQEDKAKITIHIGFQSGDPLSIRVKLTTQFSKIRKSIAEQMGISPKSFSLAFDGDRINDETTPKMLEMSDGDQVDVQLAQVGGGTLATSGRRQSPSAPLTAPGPLSTSLPLSSWFF